MSGLSSLFDPSGAFDRKEPSDLVPFILEPAAQSDQRAHASCDDRIKAIIGQHVLDTHRIDSDVEFQFLGDVLGNLGFLGNAIAKRYVQIGPEDRKQNSGHATSGTQVQDLFVGLQEFAQLVAIEQIPLHKEFRGRVPGEIDFGVPLPCQAAVLGQVAVRCIIQRFDTDLLSQLLEVFGGRNGVG